MRTDADSRGPARRVLIVDDHPIVCEGLRGLIAAEPDLEVAGEASEAAGALQALRDLRPDVIVVDISLQGTDGLELTKAVRAERPDVPILIMSMHDEALYAERSLRAGASGYIMKQAVAEHVVGALRLVLEGEIYLSEDMHRLQPIQAAERRAGGRPQSGVASLTDRELEVFRLIGHGQSTRRIADDLHLSVKTVETHRSHIKTKLRVETAPELVRRAVQWVEAEQGTGPRGA